MNQNTTFRNTDDQICRIMAELLPSTAEEIAQAAGLEASATAARLDDLARRNRVMFNPLTKRFSLPKAWPSPGLAA